MGLHSLWRGFKLWRSVEHAEKVIEKEGRMYDVGVGLQKAAKQAVFAAGGVALSAVVAFFADQTTVTGLLTGAGVAPVVVAALTPVIVGVATFVANYLKNRDR